MKLYLEIINGYEVYFSEGFWVVEDMFGWSLYDTFQEAKEAAEEVQIYES